MKGILSLSGRVTALARVWAALERIIPRGLLAGSTITAAFVTDPYAIGLYTWAALALTLLSALTDTPIQHVSIISIKSLSGRRFLRRYEYLSAVLGVLFIAASIWLISAFAGHESVQKGFVSLWPLILVPLARSFSARPTAELQYSDSWRSVMLCRFYGALIGAGIGLPLVLVSKSIFGACTTLAVSEISYTLFTLAATRARGSLLRIPSSDQSAADTQPPAFRNWPTYRHMAMFSTFGWFSGQLERVLLGAWAGTSALGAYSLGIAIGRSAGDAIAASQPGVLRAELARVGAENDEQLRKLLGANVRGGLYLTVGNAFAVVLGSVFVLPLLLGPEWNSALQMAPILALSAIPAAVAQSTAPVFIQMRKAHLSYIAPAILLVFAPVVAWMAIESLVSAAWVALLRECMLAAIQALILGRATPWREVWLASLAVIAGATAVLKLL